jgi:hypothetical protein
LYLFKQLGPTRHHHYQHRTKLSYQDSDNYPTIGVVICATNTELVSWSTLLETIQALQNQTVKPTQVIVVIDSLNYSKLSPVVIFQQAILAAGITVIVLPSAESSAKGLAATRNAGIAATYTEVVAFLDYTVLPKPNWLAQLQQHYGDPLVAGVGGTVSLNGTGGNTQLPKWLPREFWWVYGCTTESYSLTTTYSGQVDRLPSGNMSFRREILNELGGFRTWNDEIEEIPTGGEEIELCIRLKQRWSEKHLVFESKANVERRPLSASEASWAYFRKQCYAQGLAKARIAQLLGRCSGLMAERSYIMKKLPISLVVGLLSFLFRGNLRVFGLLGGLVFSSRGFLEGNQRIEQALKKRQTDMEVFCGSSNKGRADDSNSSQNKIESGGEREFSLSLAVCREPQQTQTTTTLQQAA